MALIEEMTQQGNFLFKYRGQLPLILVACGLLLFVVEHNSNPPAAILPFTHWLPYLTIGLLGLFIRIIVVGFTPAGTSGRNTAQQVANSLNTKGIYSVVRHPLYVGNFFMWLSVAMLPGNYWFVLCFILAYWLYYERIMFAEEAFLRQKYGQAYTDWSAQTPAFIPNFTKWEPAKLNFSLKNVLKREITGLWILILLFVFFRILHIYLVEIKIYLDPNLLIIFASTTLAFAVIKLLQKTTNLLHTSGR